MESLESMLRIEHPIVLGPFGGMSSVALTAAVTAAGGLGSYGMNGIAPESIGAICHDIRRATDGPFALNLWLSTGDEATVDDARSWPLSEELITAYDRFDAEPPELPERFAPTIEEQLDAVIDARPAVLSVVFGVPRADVLRRARDAGIRVLGTATSVEEAKLLDEAGVDAIVASGVEAAGHRVSFQRVAEESLVGLFSLLPQVVDAVRVPVLAAGGVADRRGVRAAFALGASGVQAGTVFLRTVESAATNEHRARIAAATDTGTVLTRAFSGRLARGIPNHLSDAFDSEGRIARYPIQNWLTGDLRTRARREGDADYQSLWAGQSAALARYSTADAAFAELRAGLPDDGA